MKSEDKTQSTNRRVNGYGEVNVRVEASSFIVIMAGRPRLVHEGLPINDDHGDSGLHFSVAPTSHSQGAQDKNKTNNLHNVATSNASKNDATLNSKPYKLQTRLVIGEDSQDADDVEMMVDEDQYEKQSHKPQQNIDHHATSQYYGSYGDVHYGNYNTQQHNLHYGGYHHTQQQNGGEHNFVHSNPINNQNAPTYPTIHQQPSPEVSPLVVLDGANIAYNYSESLHPILQSERRQPDPKGITLAIDYFLKQNCRVQAVVPISWYQLKPRPTDTYHLKNRTRMESDAKMVTEEVEELRTLRQRGFLVACPPGDDDDAYVMALARREDDRRLLEQRESMRQQNDDLMGMDEDNGTSLSQHLPPSVLGGYVVSNDMFHDAVRREDERKQQNVHHQYPLNARPISLKSWLKKNRISFSFANVGTEVDGEIRLDFLPNPRNELIEAIDECNRLNYKMG